MDWSSVIYAAIGGALGGIIGASIASIIQKASKQDEPNKNLRAGLGTVFIILGYTMTTALYKNMTLPRIVPMDVAELTEEMPVLEIIREQEPEAFKKLIFPLDKIERNGRVSDEGIAAFRSELNNIMFAKRGTASADTLRTENEVGTALFNTLKESVPHVCTQKFYGRQFQLLDEVIGDEHAEREQQVLADYFTNPPRPASYQQNLPKGEALFNEIIQKLISDLEITDLDPPINDDQETVENHKKICSLQAALNNAANALDDDDLFHVVGYISSVE